MATGSFNKVVIGGRLGRDPEIHTFDNGNRVARLSVATTEQWTNSNGVREEKTDWHIAVLFRKTAVDFAERNLRKGDLVMVEGRLENRSYEKDGEKRFVTEITVREGRGDITLMAKAAERAPAAPAEAEHPSRSPEPTEAGSRRPAPRSRSMRAAPGR
jgi:single-strand DNA-binding protein